jgi:hypothetical protein
VAYSFLIFVLLLELGPLRPLLGHVESAPALSVTGGGGRHAHALRGVFAVFGGFDERACGSNFGRGFPGCSQAAADSQILPMRG